MATRRKGKAKAVSSSDIVASPVSSKGIHLPTPAKKEGVSVGVQQPSGHRAKAMRTNARQIAGDSKLFPKGGSAFERWCSDKGISPKERRTSEEWSSLLEEFASRPVHGLRRGPDGGNHRPNAKDLRR